MPRIPNVGRIDWALNGSGISWDGKPLIYDLLPGHPNLWSVSTIHLEMDAWPENLRPTGLFHLYGKIVPAKECRTLRDNSRSIVMVDGREMMSSLKTPSRVASLLVKECAALLTLHPYASQSDIFYEMAFLNRSNRDDIIRYPTDYMLALARKIEKRLKF